MSVGAVVRQRYGQEAFEGLGGFLTTDCGAPRVTRMLRYARLVHGPVAVRDWSYISREVVGDGWILVGDAACFIDPLFSSGIHLAMMSGAMAAAYVTTVLKDESMRVPGALFYRDQYYQEYGQFREMAKLFYSTNRTVESYFWEARRILGDEIGSKSPRRLPARRCWT
jgi:flavin-dependent dehydrogenase